MFYELYWKSWKKKYHLASNSRALEEGGGPGPLGDDGGGGQPDGNLATSVEGSVQVVRIMVDVLSDHLESLSNDNGKDSDAEEDEECGTKTNRRLDSNGDLLPVSDCRASRSKHTLGAGLRLLADSLHHHLS